MEEERNRGKAKSGLKFAKSLCWKWQEINNCGSLPLPTKPLTFGCIMHCYLQTLLFFHIYHIIWLLVHHLLKSTQLNFPIPEKHESQKS